MIKQMFIDSAEATQDKTMSNESDNIRISTESARIFIISIRVWDCDFSPWSCWTGCSHRLRVITSYLPSSTSWSSRVPLPRHVDPPPPQNDQERRHQHRNNRDSVQLYHRSHGGHWNGLHLFHKGCHDLHLECSYASVCYHFANSLFRSLFHLCLCENHRNRAGVNKIDWKIGVLSRN